MQKIFNVEIDIDTEQIAQKIEDNVVKNVCDEVFRQLVTNSYCRSYSYYSASNEKDVLAEEVRNLVRQCIYNKIQSEWKDEIINASAELLCEKFCKTKAFKEKMMENMG